MCGAGALDKLHCPRGAAVGAGTVPAQPIGEIDAISVYSDIECFIRAVKDRKRMNLSRFTDIHHVQTDGIVRQVRIAVFNAHINY